MTFDEEVQSNGVLKYEGSLLERAVKDKNRHLYFLALLNMNTWISAVWRDEVERGNDAISSDFAWYDGMSDFEKRVSMVRGLTGNGGFGAKV